MNKDLYTYAKNNGIIVEKAKIPKNKSFSIRMMKKDFVIIDTSAMKNSADERTHLAHELGHCSTGAFYDIESPLIIRGKAEHKATRWAICKCVPKQKLTDLLKAGYQNWELAEYFNVTEDLIKTACTYYFEYGIAI